jgi:Mg-chelatase subunit ChlD
MTQTAAGAAGAAGRRDAYSIILFTESQSRVVENDYTSDANGLLNHCLRFTADGGTNFGAALQAAQSVMETHVGLQSGLQWEQRASNYIR